MIDKFLNNILPDDDGMLENIAAICAMLIVGILAAMITFIVVKVFVLLANYFV